MPGTETELEAEVRALTGYTAGILSDADLASLIEIARQEIREEVGEDDLEFFGQNARLTANRALFWLVCLFTKIRMGEVGGADFAIGELESQQSDDTYELWHSFFQGKIISLSENFGFGIVSPRRTDREYSFE